MKVAVSIPEPTFSAAERTAERLGVSRSELYARALDSFLATARMDWVTEQIDRAIPTQEVGLDPAFVRAQADVYAADGDEW